MVFGNKMSIKYRNMFDSCWNCFLLELRFDANKTGWLGWMFVDLQNQLKGGQKQNISKTCKDAVDGRN